MKDALAIVQAQVTKTASFTPSNGYKIPGGTPRRGVNLRILVTALSGTTPSAVIKFQESNDDGSTDTYTDLAYTQGGPITATGEYFATVETSKQYILPVLTLTGTTPSVTYEIDVVPARNG